MQGKNKRLFIANSFGVLGYLFCALQWIWVMLLHLPALLGSQVAETFVFNPSPVGESPSSVPDPNESVSGLLLILAIVIGIGVMIATVYALKRAPRTVGETGKNLTHGAATVLMPIVTHHRPLPPAKKRFLTARLAFDIKLAFIALPVGIAYFSSGLVAALPQELFVLVAALLAGLSLLFFCLQLGVAKASRIDFSRLW